MGTIAQGDIILGRGGIPTLEEIGAAPAGFGLGVNSYTVITANEINNLNKTGIYWYIDQNISIYEDGWGSGKKGWLIHIQGDHHNVLGSYQKFIPYNPAMQNDIGDNYCALERRKSDDGWKSWDWINPPMMIGEVYRTTERINGQVVYKRNNNGVIEWSTDQTNWNSYAPAPIVSQTDITAGVTPLASGQMYIVYE